MATEKEIIEHLRKLSQYKDRPLCDEDGLPYYADDGNCDETYGIGIIDGQIDLAKQLMLCLDDGLTLPELPPKD